MTRKVITVSTDDLMKKVKEVFDEKNFHHLPVVDEDNKLQGIISRHDYYKMLTTMSIFNTEAARRENEEWAATVLAEDVMSKDVVTLKAEDDLIKAIVLLQKNLYHAFPVVDHEQKVIGILTTYDLVNYGFKYYNIPVNTGYTY